MGSVRVEGPGLNLARIFREIGDRAQVESMKALVEIGASVTAAAKEFASRHSSTIPGSIHMIVGKDAVEIQAGGANVPLARLYEMGNVKKQTKRGTQFDRTRRSSHAVEFMGKTRRGLVFNHPVYGNENVWVEQARYPFLAPARRANRKVMTERLKSAWQKSFEPLRDAGGDL